MNVLKSNEEEQLFHTMNEILAKRAPELSFVANSINELSFISYNDRMSICDALADEFSETGIRGDFEPNDRGILIENIIDIVNPSRGGNY